MLQGVHQETIDKHDMRNATNHYAVKCITQRKVLCHHYISQVCNAVKFITHKERKDERSYDSQHERTKVTCQLLFLS